MNNENRQSDPPLLEVRNLSLSFHDKQQVAVDRVSFTIKAGSTLGLVGSSGAGKSSIARCIVNLARPDAGEIRFKGEDDSRLNRKQLIARRQGIQIVFQEPTASLSPRRSVQQTLLEPLKHFAIGDAEFRHDKILKALETVGLDASVLGRYPHQFSSGQQQRIAIARALITDPKLVIADEAVSSLDTSIQAQILQLIQGLQKEHGITFLFVSHDLAVIRQIADEVAVMYRGQLLEQSPADTFFSDPAHPYSRMLLSFANQETVPDLDREKWSLDRGRSKTGHSDACVFSDLCREKMPVCERLEPGSYEIQNSKSHTRSPHCVKCHLYDEERTNEI